MKKLVLILACVVLSSTAAMAQNKFKGVITYDVKSTGTNPIQIPPEQATAEIKVFENKVYTNSPLFSGNALVSTVLIDGHKQYSCWDLSMLMMYLAQQDIELSYSGSNKVVLEQSITQQEIDSLTIPCTEGFYIEYVDNETKTIAGKTAKKAIFHIFDDEGEDAPIIMWYADDMGPDVNLLFNGLRGVALEYALNLDEGKQLTLTASSIKSGKVKSVDMLLPSGFESISTDDFKALWEEISSEMELLRD